MAEVLGPEKYAPAHLREPEQRSGGPRLAYPHNQRSQALLSENLNATIQRIASVSIDEIDRLIHSLEDVRGLMRTEGERISREIAGYASLSYSAVATMKVMADSIKEWKGGPDKTANSEP